MTAGLPNIVVHHIQMRPVGVKKFHVIGEVRSTFGRALRFRRLLKTDRLAVIAKGPGAIVAPLSGVHLTNHFWRKSYDGTTGRYIAAMRIDQRYQETHDLLLAILHEDGYESRWPDEAKVGEDFPLGPQKATPVEASAAPRLMTVDDIRNAQRLIEQHATLKNTITIATARHNPGDGFFGIAQMKIALPRDVIATLARQQIDTVERDLLSLGVTMTPAPKKPDVDDEDHEDEED